RTRQRTLYQNAGKRAQGSKHGKGNTERGDGEHLGKTGRKLRHRAGPDASGQQNRRHDMTALGSQGVQVTIDGKVEIVWGFFKSADNAVCRPPSNPKNFLTNGPSDGSANRPGPLN